MAGSDHIFAGAAATKDGGLGGVFRRVTEGETGSTCSHRLTCTRSRCIRATQTWCSSAQRTGRIAARIGARIGNSCDFPDRDVQVWSIAVDRRDPGTVFAGGSPVAVYRSDDGGEHFRRMPDPGVPDRVTMSFPCRVMRFATHPRNPGELFATLEVGGVMRSRDGGESWSDCTEDLVRLAGEPRLKSRILSDTDAEGMLDGHAIAISDADPDGVMLAVRMGLFHSADQGKSWQDMQVGRFSAYTYARDIRVSPQRPENSVCVPERRGEQPGWRVVPQYGCWADVAALRQG